MGRAVRVILHRLRAKNSRERTGSSGFSRSVDDPTWDAEPDEKETIPCDGDPNPWSAESGWRLFVDWWANINGVRSRSPLAFGQ